MMSELTGQGFYAAVDDLGPDREVLDPIGLDALAEGFVQAGYDIKWLLRVITATDAYRRPAFSRVPRGADDLAGCRAPLRSDQLLANLAVTLKLPVGNGAAANSRFGGGLTRLLTPLVSRQFDAVFGFDPSLPLSDRPITMPQALFLMNAPLVERAISGLRPDLLGGLLREVRQDRVLVERLYLMALSRTPTPGEVSRCLDHVSQSRSRSEGFEDLLWALVNTAEFRHRP